MTKPARTVRTRANSRLLDLGDLLRNQADRTDTMARQLDQAIDHLAGELVTLGYPSSGGGSEWVSGNNTELTATEAAASKAWQLTSTREDIRDALTACCETAARMNDLFAVLALAILNGQTLRVSKQERDEAERARRAQGQSICRDQQHGKEGAYLWGDPLCVRPSVKGGLCQAHYMDWYRHRTAVGIDVSRDHEPAA